ncbi:MAG TPA: CBS domain-containing protein [Actinomycetota bacterium]|nr:CBS domain-containing protein [Actinomycetota bacterium]
MYDYVDGKADWLAAGLPSEGSEPRRATLRDVARRDVPTCRRDEPIHEVRDRVRAAGWDACVVVGDDRIVLGLLREEELGRGTDERVEHVMRPGPSTYRPNVPVEELVAIMTQKDVPSSPITTSDGRLVGLLVRDDIVRAPASDSRASSSEPS